MLNLISVIDGFKVVIGGHIQNLCVVLALAIAVRPPEYPGNEEMTSKAKWVYGGLICFHLLLAVVRFCSMFVTNKLRDKQSIFMLLSVFVITYLCQNWVYFGALEFDSSTKEGREFLMWLWIEVLLFYSTIVSGFVYTFISGFTPVCLKVHSPLI